MMKHLTKFFLLAFIISCNSSPKRPIDLPSAEEMATLPGLITASGNHRKARYAATGDKIVFISSQRSAHKQAQVYSYDFSSKTEKRLTYQDGTISDAVFLNGPARENPYFLYSSTTDELKELPTLIQQRFENSKKRDLFGLNFDPLIQSEIYLSPLDGSEIVRLTFSHGFDGLIAPSPKGSPIYFSSARTARASGTHLFSMNSDGKEVRQLTNTKDHDLYPDFSDFKNELLWVRFSPDFSRSTVMVSDLTMKEPKPLALPEGVYNSAVFHPQGDWILLSGKVKGDQNFELFAFQRSSGCLRKVSTFEGDELFPSFHPSGDRFVYTRRKLDASSSGKAHADFNENIWLGNFKNFMACPK